MQRNKQELPSKQTGIGAGEHWEEQQCKQRGHKLETAPTGNEQVGACEEGPDCATTIVRVVYIAALFDQLEEI